MDIIDSEHPYASGVRLGIEIPATIGITTLSVRVARLFVLPTDGTFKLGCIGAGAIFTGLTISAGVCRHTDSLINGFVRGWERARSQN